MESSPSSAFTGYWNRRYRLDKLSLGELWLSFFLHKSVLGYLAVAAAAAWLMVSTMTAALPLIIAAVAVMPIYPMVWYGLHRYVLHGQWLYRSPLTASVWKRIHFDHHRDPHDLNVLFGALHTTLPTVALMTMPIGWLIGGVSGAAAAFISGIAITMFYEFNHCIQHLRYQPKWKPLQRIKKLHLQHHFHNENVNFGITNYLPDQWFGTLNPDARDVEKSATVFNLGYTGEKVRNYPWVVRLTPDLNEETAIREGIERRRPNYS